MFDSPWIILAALPAVIFTGIDKGGFAGGAGVLTVPLMTLAFPPLEAIGIMAPILVAMDLLAVRGYWRRWDAANLRIILTGGLMGLALGALTAGMLSANGIRLLLGVISVVFALHYFAPRRLAPSAVNVVKGLGWSTLAGYGNFIAHAGGPALNVYLLPLRLDKAIYVGTASAFWAVLNAVKCAPYAALGVLTWNGLLVALLLLPAVPVGVFIGMWLNKRVSTLWFYRICHGAVLAMGVKLLWDGMRAL